MGGLLQGMPEYGAEGCMAVARFVAVSANHTSVVKPGAV